MALNHTRVVAQIKLRETERQRDRLRRRYDEIEAAAATAGDPLARLRALCDGLRDVTFARRPLHPSVREIDALYLADHLGVVPPELVAERTTFLEHELAQGRLRAEFTYAFGRVLSEWVNADAAAEPRATEDAFAPLFADPPATDAAFFAHFAAENRGVLTSIAEQVARFAEHGAPRPVGGSEVSAALRHIERHPYLARGLRREAATAAASATQVTELAGVATILLNSLDEWDWPADGVPGRTVWVRVKHRPYLDEDLVTAVFLQVIGMRWGTALHSALRWDMVKDGHEPAIPPEPLDSPTAHTVIERQASQAARFLASLPTEAGGTYAGTGLVELLATVQREIRFARAAFPDRPCYVVQTDLRDFYPSLPHATILEVLRMLGVPERWRNFFRVFLAPPIRRESGVERPTRGMALEHALADVFGDVVLWAFDLHLLRATGSLPVRLVDDIWLLADSHAAAQAGWRATVEFCRAAGLAVNGDKSGAVCVGHPAAPLDGLPLGRPKWGLLRLQSSGTWEIDEPALAAVEAGAVAELSACASVMELVAKYNGGIGYIQRQLALGLTLPDDHLGRVGRRLQRTHDELFGPGHGVPAEVGRRLRDCFADARLKEQGLPPALLYWPVTAGGLALAHPLLHVAAYLRGRGSWDAPTAPNRDAITAFLWWRKPDARAFPISQGEAAEFVTAHPGVPHPLLAREQWDQYRRAVARGDESLPEEEEVGAAMAAAWGEFYRRSVEVIEPAGPPPLDAMERLVQDFIARGGEVTGRGQTDLAAYWRWVVYAYGPSLLSSLGTFRFLLTELVPLQLILENRGLMTLPTDGETARRTPVRASPAVVPPSFPMPSDDIPF